MDNKTRRFILKLDGSRMETTVFAEVREADKGEEVIILGPFSGSASGHTRPTRKDDALDTGIK